MRHSLPQRIARRLQPTLTRTKMLSNLHQMRPLFLKTPLKRQRTRPQSKPPSSPRAQQILTQYSVRLEK